MSGRRILSTGLAALALAAAAAALAFPGSLRAAPLPLRLLLGFGVVLFLPGRLLLNALLGGRAPSGWQGPPLAFGASLTLIALLTILAIELHWNSTFAAWTLLGASAVLLAVGRRADTADSLSPRDSSRVFAALLFAGLAVLGFLLYGVGGLMGPDTLAELEEEALHVTIVRKLAENPFLTHTNLMYKADAANTYVYPPYHFALALVSRVATLDPIVAYVKFRPVAGLVSLLALHGLLVHWLPRRWLADVAALALVVLALNNVSGHVPHYYWAQLIPISHLADFGLGVMLPLLTLFVVRYVAREGSEGGWLLLTPAFIATALLVHTREVLQLLLFLGPTSVALFLFRRADSRTLGRVLAIISITVLLGLAYRERQAGMAAHAAENMAMNRLNLERRLAPLMERPVLDVLLEADPYYALLNRPIFLLALLAAPILPLAGRSFFTLFLWTGFLASLLIIRIPYLKLLFALSTYSEMLLTPARYFLPWAHLLVGLMVGVGVLVLDHLYRWLVRGLRVELVKVASPPAQERKLNWPGLRAGWPRGLALLAILGLAWAYAGWGVTGFLSTIEKRSYGQVSILYVWGALGSVAAAVYLLRVPHRKPFLHAILDRNLYSPRLGAVLSLVMLTPLYRASLVPTLCQEYRAAGAQQNFDDWWRWYQASELSRMVPPDLLRFLREEIPALQVIVYRYDRIFAVPVLSNHYVMTKGRLLTTELDFIDVYHRIAGKHREFSSDPWQSYLERSGYFGEVIRANPIFNPEEDPLHSIAFLRECRVNYLIASPDERVRVQELWRLFPQIFKLVYDRNGYMAFRVEFGSQRL